MVIEHAERFGSRSFTNFADASPAARRIPLCYSPGAHDREARRTPRNHVRTSNGFEIAETDLNPRPRRIPCTGSRGLGFHIAIHSATKNSELARPKPSPIADAPSKKRPSTASFAPRPEWQRRYHLAQGRLKECASSPANIQPHPEKPQGNALRPQRSLGETLFMFLVQVAGSGSSTSSPAPGRGREAISRGASEVVFIENHIPPPP